MSIKYAMTCECGKRHPIETFQAGRELVCECGKTLSIPSMLKIKRLPVWSEAESAQSVTEKSIVIDNASAKMPSSVPSESIREGKVRVLAGNRLGVFIVGLVLTTLFCLSLWRTSSHKPIPLQVFYKQTMFASGDNVVRRNSSPVSESDYDFFLQNDPNTQQTYIINDFYIDRGMTPAMAFIYFDVLKDLKLSENFYDNFEEIQHNHRIKTGATHIAIVFSVLLCGVPWLMPRRKKIVGEARGAQWTK